MEKYIINYHTGAGNQEVEVKDLDEAKEIAEEGIRYTQMNVSIETPEGEEVTVARWSGVRPDEEDEEAGIVLVEIGGEGFYLRWSDELENMS